MQPIDWSPFAFGFLNSAVHPANIAADVDFGGWQFLHRLILFLLVICKCL